MTKASAGQDSRTGEWVVHFGLDRIGAKRFADVSTRHVGEPFAIVLDGKVISAPVIREPIIGGQGQISGNFSVQDANDLAVLLRAGALPAPLTVVEERSIGPSLGADSIKAGLLAIAAGFTFVVGFIVATYGLFGIFAAVALIANLALTLAGLSLLGATLTLPGIAGILLALGMAVDANILINERAREEARKTNGVISALEAGFRRAYRTIVDANATTLIKMLILFAIGTGAIRGFAITISMGILISMFTAIVLVRLLISYWLQRARPKSLRIGTRWHVLPEGTAIPFMRARYSGLIVSAVISLASLGLAYHPGLRMGVDFAGGVVIETRALAPVDQAALRDKLGGLGLGQVQVQEFGSPNDVLVRFEHPHGGSAEQQAAIAKVRGSVQEALPGSEIRRVEVVGPTVGSELLRDGLWALAWAGAAMFIYIAFRFEWPFAVGAIRDHVPRSDQDGRLLRRDGVRVQPDVDRGHPDHHGLFDQRQDRRLRPRAREPDTLQEDAARRADRSQHQRDADANDRHLARAVPGDCSAGAVRRAGAARVCRRPPVRPRAGDQLLHLHRRAHPAQPGREAIERPQTG